MLVSVPFLLLHVSTPAPPPQPPCPAASLAVHTSDMCAGTVNVCHSGAKLWVLFPGEVLEAQGRDLLARLMAKQVTPEHLLSQPELLQHARLVVQLPQQLVFIHPVSPLQPEEARKCMLQVTKAGRGWVSCRLGASGCPRLHSSGIGTRFKSYRTAGTPSSRGHCSTLACLLPPRPNQLPSPPAFQGNTYYGSAVAGVCLAESANHWHLHQDELQPAAIQGSQSGLAQSFSHWCSLGAQLRGNPARAWERRSAASQGYLLVMRDRLGAARGAGAAQAHQAVEYLLSQL